MMQRCVLVCCVLVCVGASKGLLQCSTTARSSSFKMSIISRRNDTGQWITQVALDHGAKGKEKEDGFWLVDVDHTTSKCEDTESVHLLTTVTAPVLIPGPNYKLIPRLGYYKFHEVTKPYKAARDTCAQEGAHILILNSDQEFAAIKKMWALYPKITDDWRNNFIHVGLHDDDTEGQFYTIFGEHVNSTGYAKWADKEPNSGIAANCAGVTRDGFLMDSYCWNILAFVCEQHVP